MGCPCTLLRFCLRRGASGCGDVPSAIRAAAIMTSFSKPPLRKRPPPINRKIRPQRVATEVSILHKTLEMLSYTSTLGGCEVSAHVRSEERRVGKEGRF